MGAVTLNQAALNFLLENPAGPVGQDLRRRAENVTVLLRDGATTILEAMPPDLIQYQIRSGDAGLEAVVGVVGGGRWSDYLVAKEAREGKPFAPALQQGLHT